MLPLCLLATSLVSQGPTRVPHAIVSRDHALTCYKRFVPFGERYTGSVSVDAVDRLKTVRRVLEDESSFMVVGDGVCLNAFFCTTHASPKRLLHVVRHRRPRPRFRPRPHYRRRHVRPYPKTLIHRLDAYVVYEDEEGEAVRSFQEWHRRTLGKAFRLVVA